MDSRRIRSYSVGRLQPSISAALTMLPLLRAKGLMRDREGQTHSLHLVGARTASAPSSHAQPQRGRLVCIALRGELQAAHLHAALAACAV